jgi:hypothetical protein
MQTWQAPKCRAKPLRGYEAANAGVASEELIAANA